MITLPHLFGKCVANMMLMQHPSYWKCKMSTVVTILVHTGEYKIVHTNNHFDQTPLKVVNNIPICSKKMLIISYPSKDKL